MTDADVLNLSVEEIAQNLKQEVQNKKKSILLSSDEFTTNYQPINTTSTKNIQSNKLYNLAKKIAKYLKRKGFSKIVNYVKQNININEFSYIYIMADFLSFHDSQFIDNTYKLLLKRSANIEEKNYYLMQLRSGTISKAEIVISVHFSKEGREQNVKILGSKKRFIIYYIYKIPVIGYLSKSLSTLFTLPKLIKRLNNHENNVAMQFQKKVDKITLKELQRDIDKKLSTKETALEFQKQNIPLSIEIPADDFFADAISKFPYSKDKFKDFNKDELYYSLFESTFYNHEVVLQKQAVYLRYIPEINSIDYLHLDIGCGRGELLTLLKQNSYYSMGIDINSLEIQELKKQNFNVEHIDMLKFLQTTQKTFSSISALQVVEHIDYDTLKKFVSLAYKKLTNKGVLILETINPNNKVAFNSFYMDETHIRPLPPEMLAFILQYEGFKDVKFRYTSPMPIEFRSRQNENINYHDYAVIGYKI